MRNLTELGIRYDQNTGVYSAGYGPASELSHAQEVLEAVFSDFAASDTTTMTDRPKVVTAGLALDPDTNKRRCCIFGLGEIASAEDALAVQKTVETELGFQQPEFVDCKGRAEFSRHCQDMLKLLFLNPALSGHDQLIGSVLTTGNFDQWQLQTFTATKGEASAMRDMFRVIASAA